MNPKERLQELLTYFDRTRQVGHTTTMIRGAQNVDRVTVLAANEHAAGFLKKSLPKANVVSLYNLNQLKFCRDSLVFDNGAIRQLIFDSLEYINILESNQKL